MSKKDLKKWLVIKVISNKKAGLSSVWFKRKSWYFSHFLGNSGLSNILLLLQQKKMHFKLKFIYSEKAKDFCEIFPIL